MNPSNTIVSLTSIPRRIESSIWEVLDSLKKQSVKCPIVVSIPETYKKWGDYSVPKKLLDDEDIILWRPKEDYGPATKLLGALEYAKEHPEIEYVITFDDDMYYQSEDIVKYFLMISLNFPKFALTARGIKLTHPPYHTTKGLDYNFQGFIDVPRGFAGTLYPVKQLLQNNLIFKLFKDLPVGIFNDDDAYFGIVLSRLKIPLLSIPLPDKLKSSQDKGASAVEEQTDKARTINEMELFQYAVNNGFLPNENGYKNQNGDYSFDIAQHQELAQKYITNLVQTASYFADVQKDFETAMTLIKIAFKYRPSGKIINEKITEWNDILTK